MGNFNLCIWCGYTLLPGLQHFLQTFFFFTKYKLLFFLIQWNISIFNKLWQKYMCVRSLPRWLFFHLGQNPQLLGEIWRHEEECLLTWLGDLRGSRERREQVGLGLDTPQPFTACVGLSFRRWGFPIYNAERHNASKRSMSKLHDIYMRNLKIQQSSEHNIQPWCTPFPIWNQSVVPCPVLTVASWPAYRFLKMQVRWSRVGLWRRLSAKELMLLNCGVGEDSWESLGLQGDPTSPFWRRSALGFLWKEWC